MQTSHSSFDSNRRPTGTLTLHPLTDREGRTYPLWFEPPTSEAAALEVRHQKLRRRLDSCEAEPGSGIVIALIRGDNADVQTNTAGAFARENGCALYCVSDRTSGARQYRREIGSLLMYCRDAQNIATNSTGHRDPVCAYVASLDRLSAHPVIIRKVVGQLNDIGVPLYIGNLGVIIKHGPGERLLPINYVADLLAFSRERGLEDALPTDLSGVSEVAA